MAKHALGRRFRKQLGRAWMMAGGKRRRCAVEPLERRQLLAAAIPLLNSDFESPTWLSNDNVNWYQSAVQAGTQAMNYNQLDPRFGPPGWGKTAEGGAGPGPNGEGLYNEHNDSGSNQYFNYVNGQLPAPANGTNFFCLIPAPGGTYHFWVDQQPNTTVDQGNHSDINYPPMIPATYAQAGHTYQVTVALGDPLVNAGNPRFADVELDFTIGAGTYYEPSNTPSYNRVDGSTNAPQPGDTWLNYQGYGTTVASAFAYGSSDPAWQSPNFAPGMFKDLTLTWTCPAADDGLSLDIQLLYKGVTQTTCFDNVRLVDLSAAATAPTAPSGLRATATSASQISLNWTDNSLNETGFTIDQSTSSDFSANLITTTVGANVTTYGATGLLSATTYYYRVRATNALGDSANTATASATTGTPGTPVAVPIPDGDFTDTAGNVINANTGGGLTFTSPMTGTLSGWAVSASPSTANGGYYSSGGWEPYGVLDSVTSSGASPFNNNAPWLGNQPASSYHAFAYYPGEQYSYGSVVGGAQPGASLTMTTTGINLSVVAGSTYSATIQYANVSWSSANVNPSANVALNILANGAIVSTGTLSGLAQGAPWTTVTASWVAPAAYAGEAIQIQLVANNFLEGPASTQQWQVPTFAFAHATLTSMAASNLPATPSGLTATVASANQINLNWTDSSNNLTGFEIDQATSSDFAQNLTMVTVGANVTSYNATGLSTGTTYYYRVRATNAAGKSANSATVSAAPGNFPAAPSGLTATAVSSSQINLNWTDNSNNETGFKIDQATSADFSTGLTTVTVGANVTTYNATGLSSNTTYYYRVRATNATGDSANTSTASAKTTDVTPAAPMGLSATAASASQINLSWIDSSSNETGFKIDQATSADFSTGLTTVTAGANATTYNATGLLAGTIYYFRVRATNTAGDSANAPAASAITFSAGTPLTIFNPTFDDAGLLAGDGDDRNAEHQSSPYTDLSNDGWFGVAANTPGGVKPWWGRWNPTNAQFAGTTDTLLMSGPPGLNYPYIIRGPLPAPAAGTQYAFVTPYTDGGTGPLATVWTVNTERFCVKNSDGSTATVTAGQHYVASMAVGRPLDTGSPDYTLELVTEDTTTGNILQVLSSSTVTQANIAAGQFYNLTTTYDAPASGGPIGGMLALAIVCSNFSETNGVGTVGVFSNARLTVAPPAAPTAPSGLTAAAKSSSQINLSWTDNSSNETGFKIDQSTCSDFTQNLTTVSVGANVTTYSATGLSAGTTYYYRVRATNGTGDSANSAMAGATTVGSRAITIPGGSFEEGAGICSPENGPATLTSPVTASIPGWNLTITPTTYSGGSYGGWVPYAQVFTSNTSAGDYMASEDGAQHLSFFGGELFSGYPWQYGWPAYGVIPAQTVQADSAAPLATSVAGATYTATIAVANPLWHTISHMTSAQMAAYNLTIATPTFELDIVANGQVVASSTLVDPAASGQWYDLTVTWAAPVGGENIQLRASASNFAEGQMGPGHTLQTPEGPFPYTTSDASFDNARLTVTVPAGLPIPPSNLSATAVSSSQINLSWTDNSSDETGFKLDQSTSSDFTQNLTTVTVGANVTTYNATGLASGTTYYYRVRASNTVGDSANSLTPSATTQATLPAAPSGLTAAAVSTSQINLSWTDNSSNETGFKIDQSTSSDFTQNLATVTVAANATTYNATGLSANTTYYYRVRATNSAGDSANSSTASATTQQITIPAAPSGLTATAVSTSQINLSWTDNASNETGFKIDQATSSDFVQGLSTVTVGANVTTYNATGLSANATYYFRVRATNSAGDSGNSATASASTSNVPVAIPVPDGDFTDTTGYYINSNTGGGVTYTSPMTGTLSGWSLSANPSTANGGYYTSGGWGPFGMVDAVTSSGASPYSDNAPNLGNQPASSYHTFVYYPGEQYDWNDVVGGAQPGARLTMTTTGLSLAAVAGSTYTATIQYANVSWSNSATNPSANVALNILANGVVVGTGTLAGLAQGSPWATVTASWVTPAAFAGQAIQLQVVATNFLEGPGITQQWQVPTFAFAHATLTSTPPAMPAAPSALTAVAVSSSQINLTWTDNSSNETGFKIDRATSADFSTGLATVTVGANVTSYSATGLSSKTTYYFRVRATNAAGDSANASAASATTVAAGTPVAIPVPDGDFTDPAGYYLNSDSGGGLTFTSPMTGTLAGWSISATPSTANGGYYAAWQPLALVDVVTSGTGANPYNSNMAWLGNQPASSYQALVYYPGEQYNVNSVVGGAQPGASLTMTTTGINTAVVAGNTYTATILCANASWSVSNVNPSANVALNILANGVVVATGTLAGLAQNSPWTPVTVTWTATSSCAGQAIQLQVVANNFLEGPAVSQQWQVPTIAFTHANLTTAAPFAAPAVVSLAAASDTGTSNSDDITSLNNANAQSVLQFNLTGVIVGATVDLYAGSTLIGSGVAAASDIVLSTNGTTALADGVYQITATQQFGSVTSAVSAPLAITIDTAAPAVSGVTINDGSIQRSMVNKAVVVFSQPVVVTDGSLIIRQRGGGIVPNVTVTANNPSNDGVTWVLTFSGSAIVGGSLPDGAYKLRALAAGIQDIAGNAMPADYKFTFYRLFGDVNGDRTVSRSELVTMRSALGQPANYLWYLDYDTSGAIDMTDYLALRARKIRSLL